MFFAAVVALCLLVVQGIHGAEAPRADNLVFCPSVRGFRREQSKQPFEKQKDKQNFVSQPSGVTVVESCLFPCLRQDLTLLHRLALNLQCSHLSILHSGTVHLCYHVWQDIMFFKFLFILFILGGSSC